ncbi:hypothetical protein NPIL_114071 [Nephila pilipes]|uniref:Uncharacterized protein n=1 Tax=Nephila pilipes TaxID=299642 RepID=A0A8X6NNF8_NEPPI|nr:hypothetical protein NPIL_211101 [Nephila pilipes]GFT42542.1 hypothetical protein NPIL_114071 [Nephila pilipes]
MDVANKTRIRLFLRLENRLIVFYFAVCISFINIIMSPILPYSKYFLDTFELLVRNKNLRNLIEVEFLSCPKMATRSLLDYHSRYSSQRWIH